eukprot:jgi/Tetstr1/423052/TSEL_013823.t1
MSEGSLSAAMAAGDSACDDENMFQMEDERGEQGGEGGGIDSVAASPSSSTDRARARAARRQPAEGSPPGSKGDSSSSKLLKNQLKLCKVKRCGVTRVEIVPLQEQLSFDKGFYVFIRAIQLLSTHNDGVIMVGLAGPSGSGKTAFSAKVKNLIPGIAVLSMDNYNDSSLLIDDNFDDPRLTDYELLLQNIRDLRSGKAAQVPIYDFKTSRRSGYYTVEVPQSRVIIVEGIYALSQKLKSQLDLRVSVTGGVHFDLVKRVLRDIDRSGQAPEVIIQQVSDTVYPMYKAFIEPDLATAHIQIYNTFNPFSGFMDATYILKSARCPSEAEIDELVKDQGVSKLTEAAIYDIYLLPPGEDPETCQSWLRMRNRDGRYSLVFEEWVTDGPFIISPRISFEVSVRILGGLMALGYAIGTIMRRTSTVWKCPRFTVKIDEIEGMPSSFIQIQGKFRKDITEIGRKLGLEGTYVPQSYIEQVQMNKLTDYFTQITENLKREIVGASQFAPGSFGGEGVPLGATPPGLGSLGNELTRGTYLHGTMELASPPRPMPPSRPRTTSGTHQGFVLSPREESNGSDVSGFAPAAGGDVRQMGASLERLADKVGALVTAQPVTAAALETQIKLLTRENHLLVEEVRKLAALMQEHLAPGSPRSPAQGDSQAQAHYALGLERGAAASPPMALFGCVAVTVAALAGALSGVAITKMLR